MNLKRTDRIEFKYLLKRGAMPGMIHTDCPNTPFTKSSEYQASRHL